MKYAPRKVYIKKDGDYVELSYQDFCRRRQADQSYMDKLFISVQGCLLEVVREQYTDFYRDKERWRYLKKLDTNHSLLSLEGFTDSEGNVIDFVVDEAVDVAETVIHAAMVDRLKAALPLLSGSEQALINAYRLLGGASFTRMLQLLWDTWKGDSRSLTAALLAGMALFVETYDTELNDRTFVSRLSQADPDEINRRGRADFSTSNNALRFARVILEKYNGQRRGRKLPYRFRG